MKIFQQISLIALLALAPVWVVQAQQQTPDLRLFSGDRDAPLRAGAASSDAATTPAADAPAAATSATTTASDGSMGAATRGWVDLQISGSAAVGTALPMPGEVADAVYTRYLNSFTQPIPAEFKRQTSSSEGQGGSGSSSR